MTVTNSKIDSSSKQLLEETKIGGNRDVNKVIELIDQQFS